MKLLVIGGFLGSGKTTLLLRIARQLVARSLKIAVIENEIGTIGLDNKYLALEGIPVQELFGGCVCCTLTGSLVAMLKRIEGSLAPDWVLVEPSGVATPGDLVASLRFGAPTLETITVINLLDAPRFEALATILQPMLEDYVMSADIVVINKIDEVDADMVTDIRRAIALIRTDTPVVAMSADRGQLGSPLLHGLLGS